RPERDRIRDVPSIRAHARADTRPVGHRNARVEPRRYAETPCVVEVVLRSRPLDDWSRAAIDVEALVALAEPPGLALDDAGGRGRVHGSGAVQNPGGPGRVAGLLPAAPAGTVLKSTWCPPAAPAASSSRRGSTGSKCGAGPRW